MSKISKYLQINEHLLIEYTYDLNAMAEARNRDMYIIKDKNNKIMLLEQPIPKTIYDDYKKGMMFGAIPQSTNTFFYSGHLRQTNTEDVLIDNLATKLSSNNLVNSVIATSKNMDVPYESIKVYINTGYTFADTTGFVLNVQAYQGKESIFKSAESKVVLGSFFFHKNLLSTVQFAKRPFYQHGRFYDRYIEFFIPSAYYLSNHKSKTPSANNIFDLLNIDNGKMIEFNFSLVNSLTSVEKFDDNYIDFFKDDEVGFSDKFLFNQGTGTANGFITTQVVLLSNANNFNLKLYEDTKMNCIRYYPIWGDVIDDNPVTRKIMNSIENGSIPLSIGSFLDDNDSALDDFEEIYGENARKWIIVNEIVLDFHYLPIISADQEYDNEIIITRKFNFTEDFEEDVDNYTKIDDLYKFVYRPVIESLNNGFVCQYITVNYTGRLVNRLNGSEIIRNASLVIEDAESKFGIDSATINVSNIYKWKIFNKHETEEIKVSNGKNLNTNRTKYITKFIDNSTFTMMDEQGNSNVSGKFVINLFESDHIYKLRLFTDPSLTTPYQLLDTNATYVLRISSGSENTPVFLNPTYSLDMNTVIGELEYNIPETTVKKILEGDRKWAIIAKTETGSTTLFAGKFKSVYENEEE